MYQQIDCQNSFLPCNTFFPFSKILSMSIDSLISNGVSFIEEYSSKNSFQKVLHKLVYHKKDTL